MPTEAKRASPLCDRGVGWAAIASLLLHASFLLAPIALSTRALEEPARPAPDHWTARSVEVGTVPDLRAPSQEPPTNLAAGNRALPEPAQLRPTRARARAAAAPGASTRAAPPAPATPAVSSAPAGSESAGSPGAVGLPPGVRHLATAFTRALPAGGYKDAAWLDLPLGPLGEAKVSLEVTETGELGHVEVEPETGLPPALDRMLKRALLLLKSGTFSLDARQVRGGGSERLDIRVSISTRSPNPDELAAPGDLFAQSFQAPKPGVPGFARFTLNSGRQIEAVVRYATASLVSE